MLETTYTDARANLADLLERVSNDRQTVIIRRRGREDVAIISAAELAGLSETAHLLRSPKNAKRLLKSLAQAKRGQGRRKSVDALKREVGLG
jgi:antitoxin YefM